MSFKSGFIAIIGDPNVGKSTLLNKILQEKVAIVSPKPQTTRNKIIGILNREDCQLIFTDTPGMHTAKNKLDEYMQESIDRATQGVDIVVIVLDGSKPVKQRHFDFVNKFDRNNVILVINKTDESSFEKLYPVLEKFNALNNIKEIVPISAKTGKNVDVLVNIIKDNLNDGVKYFDQDLYTDKSVRFLVSEIIREKALWLLQDEIPHGIAIDLIEFKESDKLIKICADIVCEKQTHKQIIIGQKGDMLKNIGIKSRVDIERLVDKKIMLELFVKVRDNWRNNNLYVKDLGYNQNEI